MNRPTVDDLKRQRDGHLWATPSVHKRIWKPHRWLIERDENGEPARMWWNGHNVAEWEKHFGDRQWVMPDEIPSEWTPPTTNDTE